MALLFFCSVCCCAAATAFASKPSPPAQASPANAAASPLGQGIVIGTMSADGSKARLTHAYAAQRTASQGSRSESNITRVLLTTTALTREQVASAFDDHWDGKGAPAVVVDIDDDNDVWIARLAGSDGWRDLDEDTTKVGEAMILDGRACGRIAARRGGSELFKASFSIGAEGRRAYSQSKLQSSLLGAWRMSLFKTNQENHFQGQLQIERSDDGLMKAFAKIVDKTTGNVVDEVFDVRVDEDGVHMHGVVDPDETWMADWMDLHVKGSVLAGESEDEGGEIARVELRRPN